MKQVILLLMIIFACSTISENKNNSDDIIIQSSEWEEVWNEEFDGESLDESSGISCAGGRSWVNNELQAYTDRDKCIYEW